MRVLRYSLLLFAFFLPFLALAQERKTVIAFASDTQEPMWVEKLFLKADHNPEATKLVFGDVDQLHPSAFFILGDVVSLGKSNKAWKNIDGYIRQTTHDSIPVYATLGNHEVMFNTKKGTKNFQTRFPMYNPAGYTEVVDSVAVILLNSNFATMTREEADNQNTWYQNKLKALDDDPAIRFVIVGCHHSPYTNSRIVKPSVPVQENFVPPFVRSKKCVLFLSGHSHNFERFKVDGKDFLVIGGGGGLHQPLNSNNDHMHDLAESYKPAFHYLEVRRLGDTLQITSRELRNDFSGFDDGLNLSVHF
ncbi:metallophosphoesterase family protein [Mucilaginibacter ginsenosidivorans]|uniref:Metallophosphoesterase n=1 Tax=Mucilaginibacter ginsenosidivorans TaxID=398053 RepID=A0A5B8UYF4_9SPHI|nr:metallophosphoesterase [Mucilaginibacter ginsenosidivorans]QEC64237.1 metallophosphoesterase [Mucilaginibacter ginsenosidivorans]